MITSFSLPFSVLSLWDWPLTWQTIILQCYYTVGWVIWLVKSSLKWPIMCWVGRWTLQYHTIPAKHAAAHICSRTRLCDNCSAVGLLICVLISALYKLSVCLLNFFTYFLPCLSASSRIGPFHFQAGYRIWPNIALGICVYFMFILCCSIFCYRCMFRFVVFDLVFQYLAKRLTRKNVSEMNYFVSGGT